MFNPEKALDENIKPSLIGRLLNKKHKKSRSPIIYSEKCINSNNNILDVNCTNGRNNANNPLLIRKVAEVVVGYSLSQFSDVNYAIKKHITSESNETKGLKKCGIQVFPGLVNH